MIGNTGMMEANVGASRSLPTKLISAAMTM